MQKSLSLKLSPQEAGSTDSVKQSIAANLCVAAGELSGYRILKRSADARGSQVFINLRVLAFINEPMEDIRHEPFGLNDVTNAAKKVIVIGTGPAGLFAALGLIENGLRPVILERGKEVRARRRDLALLNKQGIVNPDSNYCFGEGGAGTYSDGKLYTRSSKRGNIDRVLQTFVQFGATPEILFDAHPHIGTNKLPQIITAMRQKIIECGGEILFDKKISDLRIANGRITEAVTSAGETFSGDAYILATGHSARDIFHLLQNKKLLLEPKPFALGVRIEHPQSLIDSIQYNCKAERSEFLPPASYSLVHQTGDRGVFSFCICPGGIIAPAATDPGELVVNGWSPSKRNNPFANSGMVVQTELKDVQPIMKQFEVGANDPLIFMKFQQLVEQRAYVAGGGGFRAPAQRMTDFIQRRVSRDLPESSYLPGLTPADLHSVLPEFIFSALAKGFTAFGKKLRGYLTSDAVVVAPESRTSSPVRIPRDAVKLTHPQLTNLYPCGEGAGYAGGIVSAALDGLRIAAAIT